ncbi:MAG: hypothetical protein SCK70_07280, partial [bacterium]|nr:hypothetical protein [bacterium]
MNKSYQLILITLCFISEINSQEIKVDPIKLLGNRSDKNSVGHGVNVALYPGRKPLIFYATHKLGPIFSPANQTVLEWFPDHVKLASAKNDTKINEECELCVTEQDVIVAQYTITNNQKQAQNYAIIISGDNRESINWRGKTGGVKKTSVEGNFLILSDSNVFPEIFNDFYEIIGSSEPAQFLETNIPGSYKIKYEITIPAKTQKTCIVAVAVGANKDKTKQRLTEVIKQKDPVAQNRASWLKFFTDEIPRFSCSDRQLEQLYYFRWFLLKFSTAGG